MANIKHVATDLTIAVAVAAALGWSASLPRQPVDRLEEGRVDASSALMTSEDVVLSSKAILPGAATDAPAQTKGVAERYCKSPLSGKQQISTRKS